MIQVAGPPERWIVHGGRPSEVVRDTHGGIPSYESDTGKILVYDLLVAFDQPVKVLADGGVGVAFTATMLFPIGYAMAAARSVYAGDHELCALHDDPEAAWVWRPLVYRLGQDLTRLGSQQELEWRWMLHEQREAREEIEAATGRFMVAQIQELRRRYGRVPHLDRRRPGEWRLGKNARKRLHRDYVAEVQRLHADPELLPALEANDRADLILREHLAPQQLLDLDASGGFYSRGTIHRLYRVELGNGAQIVDPETRRPVASMCLHPERWMPHADVALATKLAIESGPEREKEMLAGARTRWYGSVTPPTRGDRAAWERERNLLPSPGST